MPAVPSRMIIAPAVVADETALAAGIAAPVAVAAYAASGWSEASCFSSAATLLEVVSARTRSAPAASFRGATDGVATGKGTAAASEALAATAFSTRLSLHARASAPREPAATNMPAVRRV